MQKIFILLFFQTLAISTFYAQVDSTGLPGDGFTLEGALELFKKSESPEDFEKALNEEKNYVNNLDLNQDGEIDYVRVMDYQDGDVHAIALQAIVAEDEFQDIAVLEIEKTGDEEAILQIIGDEDIFGEEIIVEPFEEEQNGKGPDFRADELRIVVNVWLWPSVRFIYRPVYVAWVSPWRWHYYPRWWSPWRPFAYHRWIGFRPHFHLHYHVVGIHRVPRAHYVYAPRRTTSVTVHRAHHTKVVNYRTQRGISNTKKTTVVQGPRGGNAVIQKEKTTVAKRTGDGKVVKGTQTETKVKATGPRGSQVSGKKTTGKVGAKTNDGNRVTASRSKTTATKKTATGTTRTKKATSTATKKTPRRH